MPFLSALYLVLGILCIVAIFFLPRICGVVYIPHDRIGVIEKLWSGHGSLAEGRIIAVKGEAGYQARMLRGGMHFWLFPWQFRIHRAPLVTIAEGRIGYVYAKDGAPLEATQTLGQTVSCNHFQEAHQFLDHGGQRGRQRAILREGVYAINPALFVVITESQLYAMAGEGGYQTWQQELAQVDGFRPVNIGSVEPQQGGEGGCIGVVTVHDGPTIDPGEIIAPEVGNEEGQSQHSYFQDPEAFLALGGKRGRQLQVLTDGTFFLNRWFATVEIDYKTTIQIGYVGVVVSYYGQKGSDTTGETFRYGEQVETGQKGVWRQALAPGKYALNPCAVKIEMVPTVNFVLRWITGQAEDHRYDDQLATIELITSDGYEPLLPLSLVLHIDYQKASSVVQRFGDVKRLITQTLDPILTAYFRDVAQNSTMLELLTHRETIQKAATLELGKRFREFDINCVAVLIGRPESKEKDPTKDPIERLFDQLRQRRLADEQRETYAKQEESAKYQRSLEEAKAAAGKQEELTQSKINIEVKTNMAEAQLAEAKRLAQRDIALAEGRAQAQKLEGQGEASKIQQIGEAEAAVFTQKIAAYGDPRLFALKDLAGQLTSSTQPLVPHQVLMTGSSDSETGGILSPAYTLLQMLVAEKTGWNLHPEPSTKPTKPSEPIHPPKAV